MAGNPDRQYVSQFSTPQLGLFVYVGGVLADPDGSSVTVTMVSEQTNATVFTRTAVRDSIGQYHVQLISADSASPNNYTLTWNYLLSTISTIYQTYITVGLADANYDSLAPEMKTLVEGVWFRFSDLYDSPEGGPNLQTYFETRFTRGRVAQLLGTAIDILNTQAQPHMQFSVGGDSEFPVAQWGGLLSQALYVEVIKHLRRSYVEQPDLRGGAVTRLDRRDYLDRWSLVLQDEQATLKQMLDVFKISFMSLSTPSVLVSGGVFSRYGPTRYAGSAAARPRYWTRYF